MRQSFWERISNRTFISYIVSYLVASWGILQFVDWIVGRYNYSPIWTDLFLLFLILILPGVISFAWWQANEGSKNTRGAMILPINILLAIGFIFFASKNSLFAQTTTVTVTDEEGQEVLRAVPKQVATKRIIFFPFTQESGTPDWQSLGWSYLQALDIEQDNRVFTSSSLGLKDDIKGYGYEIFDKIPFSVQRKIAQDRLADFWITCSITDSLSYQVFATKDGVELMSKSYPKTDYFTEIDAFSADLSEVLFDKEFFRDQEKYVDLPATELLSSDADALKVYFEGKIVSSIQNNHTGATQLFQKATTIDPNFATAFADLGRELFFTGNAQACLTSYEKALSLSSPLPERQQFDIKSQYYGYKQDAEKVVRLSEMWRKLYPKDYRPYLRLFQFYQVLGKFEQAVEIGDLAIEAGHQGPMLLYLAQLNTRLAKYEKAESYLKQYQEVYPEKAANTKEIGSLYLEQGDFNKAIDFFEELTVLDPTDYEAYLSLASALAKSGNFTKAERTIKTSLRNAKTLKDSISVYRALENTLAEQGRMKETVDLMENRWSLMRTIFPEIIVTADLMNPMNIYRYTSIGRNKEIKDKLIAGASKVQQDEVDFECAVLINYYVAAEDGPGIKKQMESCRDDVFNTSGELLVAYVEGIQEKFLGNYEAAIPKLKYFVDSSGLSASTSGITLLADCYRLDGQLDKAQNMFEEVLKKVPNNPDLLYYYALTLNAAGKHSQAKEQLNKAFEVWKNADENYQILLDSKALMKSIENQS